MGGDIVPVKPDWKHRLDDTLIAEQELLGIDHLDSNKSRLDSNIKNFTDQIKAVSIEAVEQGRDLFEGFLATVSNLEKTPIKQWDWEVAIEAAVQKLKRDFYLVVIGEMEVRLWKVVEGLPEEERGPAYDLDRITSGFVIYFLFAAKDQTDEIVKGLYEFLLGIWDRIGRVRKDVQQLADGATQRINRVHLLSEQATDSQTALQKSHILDEKQGQGVKPWSNEVLRRNFAERKLTARNMD